MSILRVKLSTKLWGGFGVVLALLCVLGYLGITRLASISNKVEDVAHIRIPQMVCFYNIMAGFDVTAMMVRNIALTSDPELKRNMKEKYEKGKTDIKLARQSSEHSLQSASHAKYLIIVIGCVALIVGVLTSFFLTRSITRPINRIVAGLSGEC